MPTDKRRKAQTEAQVTADQITLPRRMVVKLGTNLLTAGTDRLDLEMMSAIVSQVARLHQRGIEQTIVSSGAIAAGRRKLAGRPERRDVPYRQILASVGQSSLMSAYEQLFAWHGITVAQALLTKGDLSDRHGYLNARNTLLGLMEMGVICIVNENDVVATDEIREARFGDNDNLSAMAANLVDADLLVILTDTGGLYTADPHKDPAATLIPRVEVIDAWLERLAGGTGSQRGTGGMMTKLEAAKLATASGVGVVIAGGQTRDVLVRLASGEALGTFFPPTTTKLESRQRWLLSGLASRGELVIDSGAVKALTQQDKSLLPPGVVDVRGHFSRGETVQIVDQDHRKIGYGISNYSCDDIKAIMGEHSDRIASVLGHEYGDEVIHRNNLVVL
ncbi:MAG: glutamate 5-kinase [Chloroflexi bacterium]|nr:glutamate 5-kinase [Chloroflexota bacterium]